VEKRLLSRLAQYSGGRFSTEFSAQDFFKPPSGDPQETVDDGTQRSYLNIFGLDVRDNIGTITGTGDGFIDNDSYIINLARGELILPDLEPFEPDGVIVADQAEAGLPQNKYVSTMYQSTIQSEIYRDSKFYFEVKFKGRISNTYSLGFNVIEGSEEVLLDGRRLQRDTDYNIDYFSGNLVILNEDATKPGHNLEISYQGNQLFQLEKKTIIGTRAEYRLNENSFFGGTFLYLNQSTLDQRVRLGSVDSGPMRNLIWDFNAALRFQPNFLSRALNALPFISTQEPSDLRFEGEIAQILPNPNTIDSKIPPENRIPGDKDGVAFIDDFEATKRTTSLGVNRRGWVMSSVPEALLNDPRTPQPPDNLGRLRERGALARRGTLLWYNPYRGIATQSIYPNKTDDQIDAGNATTQVLTLVFAPQDSLAGQSNLSAADSWGGIMRALSPGFYDQNESKFLEIWFYGDQGRMHVDLGQISEDAIPNGKLNTEDTFGGIRNSVLDNGEDIGLDGVAGEDNAANFSFDGTGRDFWDLNGNQQRDWGEPASNDSWFYRYTDERGDEYIGPDGKATVNGTEKSKDDGNDGAGTIRPDTEDLNNNGDVDLASNYFSYTFDLDTTSADNKYKQGGKLSAWKLYRIPLADTVKTVGRPNLSRIEYVRIWLDGFKTTTRDSILVADISLAGNEWKEVGIDTTDGTVAGYKKDPRVEVTVVNTDENTNYQPPDDISGELDRVRNIRTKEQSQVVSVKSLRPGEIAAAQKTFFQPLSLINYNRVKMYVYGDNVTGLDSVEFFIRFGADTSNYYEFREQVFAGWQDDTEINRNAMDLDLVTLATLKLNTTELRPVPGSGFQDYLELDPQAELTRQTLGLQPTQTVRVRGNPALTNIRTLIAGVKNVTKSAFPFTGAVWMDELRVTNVKRDKGIAMRARVDLKLADFMPWAAKSINATPISTMWRNALAAQQQARLFAQRQFSSG
jgi:cell surface protein SprA